MKTNLPYNQYFFVKVFFFLTKYNFVKIIIKLIFDLLSFFLYPFFKIFKIKILNSDLSAIGHQCFDLESFKIDNPNPKFRPIVLYSFLPNKYLFDHYQNTNNTFLIVKNLYIAYFLKYLSRYRYLSYNTKKYTSYKKSNAYKLFQDFQSYQKLDFNLYYSRINKSFERFKFNLQCNYVVLHCRDISYRPDDQERFRDANINSFIDAAKYLKSLDYKIVRLGNYGMNKIELENHEDLICDFTTENFDNDVKEYLDLLLISNSKMFIGSCSGFYNVATLFNIPVIQTNVAPLAHTYPNSKLGIGIPKLYFCNRTKKILNYNEIFSRDLAYLRRDKDFKKEGVKLIDNTSTSIKEAVGEMLNILKDGKIVETNNQQQFRKIMSNYDKYSFDSASTVSEFFLKENIKLI